MAYDPRVHHRRSIRLRGYGYTQPGSYFVTMVTHRRAPLFGEIAGGKMRLNDWGKIAAECWLAIPDHYDHVGLDEFTVMPNHIHGIILISENGIKMANNVGATLWVAPTKTDPNGNHPSRGGKITIAANSIGSMVGQYKSIAAKRINTARGTPAMAVWQRNYWEHIIRNDTELARIRGYIRNNPMRWEMDTKNR